MKKILIFSFGLLFFIGCNSAETKVQTNSNAAANIEKTVGVSTVSSHSQVETNAPMPNTAATIVPKSDTKTKWTQSGNPIDTTKFDADIKQAEGKLKSNPKDENLKKTLADAYNNRGMALTEARQYASALGDYRRALKLDPANEEAKKWIAQIISIYDSINRSYPNEGEEPPPLPFEKSSLNSDAQRLKFDSGATTLIAKGNLKNYDDSKTFVIEVNAGQKLKTEQIKNEDSVNYITVSVIDSEGNDVSDSDASCNNRKEVSPTVAGNYKLKVIECRKADAWKGNFDLKVSVN